MLWSSTRILRYSKSLEVTGSLSSRRKQISAAVSIVLVPISTRRALRRPVKMRISTVVISAYALFNLSRRPWSVVAVDVPLVEPDPGAPLAICDGVVGCDAGTGRGGDTLCVGGAWAETGGDVLRKGCALRRSQRSVVLGLGSLHLAFPLCV
jgi:hypothetical protein